MRETLNAMLNIKTKRNKKERDDFLDELISRNGFLGKFIYIFLLTFFGVVLLTGIVYIFLYEVGLVGEFVYITRNGEFVYQGYTYFIN